MAKYFSSGLCLVAMFAILSLASCDDCPYIKISPDHTGCKSENASCGFSDKGIPPEKQQHLVELHNRFRNYVKSGKEQRAGGLPKSTNMREIVWDKELADIAQKHAEQCQFVKDCNDCRKVERFDVGQIILKSKDLDDYDSLVNGSYNEVGKFDKKYRKPYVFNKDYAHFSQRVKMAKYFSSGRCLVVVFALLSLASCDDCPYSKINPDHTGCKSQNMNCGFTDKGIPPEKQQHLVELHNRFRNFVKSGMEKRAGWLPKARNMREMVWDKELADIAQKHAEQCRFVHDCKDCRKVERFDVGQIIYNGNAPDDYDGLVNVSYDEVQTFDKNFINPYMFNRSYENFSQILWADTYKLGCGRSVFEEEGSKEMLLVCNYGPAGNIKGQPMYKAGKPCSACPPDTTCGKNTKGLCRENAGS